MKKQYLFKQFFISAGVSSALLFSEGALIQMGSELQGADNSVANGLVYAAEREVRRTPALRNKVYEKMIDAQKLIDEKKVNEGLRMLQGMLAEEGRRELNSYERAMVWRTIANVYLINENYAKALNALEKVLQQPNIPEQMETQMLYTVAQIQMMQEDYSKAIASLKKWLSLVETPSIDGYMLLGQAYLQIKQWDNSLEYVQKGIALAKERQAKPKETWYILLRVLYYEKKDMAKVVEILEFLVQNWPKKEYFVQLATMYGEVGKEKQQLYMMEVAYEEGMLTRESEILTIAQLYASNDMPYKAAKVMEKGISDKIVERTGRNLEFLGDSWRRAQETRKAIPALESSAQRSDTGKPYIRLANLYISIEEYGSAVKAIRKALEKGKLKNVVSAQMLLGQALFYTKQFEEAEKVFKKLREDKKQGKAASQWLEYSRSEAERYRQIEEYLK